MSFSESSLRARLMAVLCSLPIERNCWKSQLLTTWREEEQCDMHAMGPMKKSYVLTLMVAKIMFWRMRRCFFCHRVMSRS